MAKTADLPKAYTFRRKIYGPGETEVPDDLFDSLVEAGVLESDGSAKESAEDEDLFAGLTDEQVASLEAAGYTDAASIAEAEASDLEALDHIGPATASKLKERAGDGS